MQGFRRKAALVAAVPTALALVIGAPAAMAFADTADSASSSTQSRVDSQVRGGLNLNSLLNLGGRGNGHHGHHGSGLRGILDLGLDLDLGSHGHWNR